MAKLWRDSASLIILARNHNNIFQNGNNYKVLVFTRSAKTSFMPNSCAFPGGATEATDQSKDWIKHFQNFGITESRLQELGNIKGDRPPIFHQNDAEISKEISLRISAIRETFEEVGVLICKNKAEIYHNYEYGNFLESFDREKWQKIVHNDPDRFLELCQTLNVVPDLWSLYEWSAWLTPASFPKRFETAFFLVGLNKIPNLIAEEHEVEKIYWESPEVYETKHKQKEIWLPPPQSYELGRLKNMPSLDILVQYAKKRNSQGITLLFPVSCKCSDGVVALLPGDDAYPENPNDMTEMLDIKETMEEFRKKSKKLHRTEYRKSNSMKFHLNFELPNQQLSPIAEAPKL